MVSLAQLGAAHRRRQVALGRRTAVQAARLWRTVDQTRIARSWTQLLPRLFAVVAAAQGDAAHAADTFVSGALSAQGIVDDPAGTVRAHAFAGVASDGRDLPSLLYQPAITALAQIGAGAPPARAMTGGLLHLDMIVRTQVADAGRTAAGAALTAHPRVTGYVRMLSLPSCSRCIILAGRWYRYNAAFNRHPRCDCIAVPAAEDTAGDARTDPRAVFDQMDPADQDRVFTAAGARAIRDGADMNQVVNARRGARGLSPAGARLTRAEVKVLRGGRDRGHLEPVNVFGHDLLVTTEGTTTRGQAGTRLGARDSGTKTAGGRYRSARPPRLMPESIYQVAGDDRAEAIRLLKRFGYIT